MIAIQDIAYVRYQVPDLTAQALFMQEFGLRQHKMTAHQLQMASYSGGYPAYIAELGPAKALGTGYFVHSLKELQRVGAHLNVPVLPNEELGAGWVVSTTDPDGLRVDLLFGGQVIDAYPVRPALCLNNTDSRRRLGIPNRAEIHASHIMRLGHVVLKTVKFKEMLEFYQGLLGMRISDSYFSESQDNTVVAFLHCGLGQQYTDHHTVALLNLGAAQPGFDHCAFEVLDWDDLSCGNQYLTQRDRRHSWGIGRHVHGSQIFDYWQDPFGNKVEHWTDGDLVNDDIAVSHSALTPDALAQWAPPLSPHFLD